MNRCLALLLAVSLFSLSARAEKPAPGKQVELSFKTPAGLTIPYLLYLPKNLDPEAARKWPVILFLHGRGESRGPLKIVAKWGPPRMAARGDDLPYLVISPQCPADSRWNADNQQKGLLDLLDHLGANYPVDQSRLYLTGLSMGGYGSWKLAVEHGKRFAAAAIICGAGNPADAGKLVDLPIWVFHGTEDRVVPYKNSAEMVEAIEKAGGKKIRFTTFKGVGHNSWSAAYATPELYQWFDRHKRSD